MSINQIRQDIEQRFVDNWVSTDLTNGVRWSNLPFKPDASASPWVTVDVRFGDGVNAEIHNNLSVRRNGQIVVEIFATVDSGTGTMTTLVDSVLGIFENAQFEGIQCLAGRVRHTGVPNIQGTDPQWYMYSVRIPFYKYDI